MDQALHFLTDAALLRMREQLAGDPEYRQVHMEEAALRAQLRRRYSSQVRQAVLDAVDAESTLSAMETERAFLLGLQLGLSLGRLSLLPNE